MYLRGMHRDNLGLFMVRVKLPWHFEDDTLGNIGKVKIWVFFSEGIRSQIRHENGT